MDILKRMIIKNKERKSKKLATAGFIVGAAMAAESKDASLDDVLAGGVIGVFAAAVFEVMFPKTSNAIKSIL